MSDAANPMETAFLESEAAPHYLMLDADGYVMNVVVGDPSHCIHEIEECEFCVPSEGLAAEAGIGWRRLEDGSFLPPPEPDPEA